MTSVSPYVAGQSTASSPGSPRSRSVIRASAVPIRASPASRTARNGSSLRSRSRLRTSPRCPASPPRRTCTARSGSSAATEPVVVATRPSPARLVQSTATAPSAAGATSWVTTCVAMGAGSRPRGAQLPPSAAGSQTARWRPGSGTGGGARSAGGGAAAAACRQASTSRAAAPVMSSSLRHSSRAASAMAARRGSSPASSAAARPISSGPATRRCSPGRSGPRSSDGSVTTAQPLATASSTRTHSSAVLEPRCRLINTLLRASSVHLPRPTRKSGRGPVICSCGGITSSVCSPARSYAARARIPIRRASAVPR